MLDRQHGWNVSVKPLIIGFILAILLTYASYRFVTRYHVSHNALTWSLLSFAVFQAIIQMVFFLHVGLEAKPRWNLGLLLFMVLVTVIVVGGSIWIMHNLSYNVVPPGINPIG